MSLNRTAPGRPSPWVPTRLHSCCSQSGSCSLRAFWPQACGGRHARHCRRAARCRLASYGHDLANSLCQDVEQIIWATLDFTGSRARDLATDLSAKATGAHGLGKCARKWSRSRGAAARVSSVSNESWRRHARSSFESSSSHVRRRSSSTRRHCGLQYSRRRPGPALVAIEPAHARQIVFGMLNRISPTYPHVKNAPLRAVAPVARARRGRHRKFNHPGPRSEA